MQKIGVDAYKMHQDLFRGAQADANSKLWKQYYREVFDSLRNTNPVLHKFVNGLIKKKFTGYNRDIAFLGIAMLIKSFSSIPRVTDWTCDVIKLDLMTDESNLRLVCQAQEYFEESLSGAYSEFREFLGKVCGTKTALYRDMLGIGYIMVIIFIHQGEHEFIQQQIQG
jgi:hypothetical protein